MPKVNTEQLSYELAVRRGALWGRFFGSLPDPDLIMKRIKRSKASVFEELRTDPDIGAAIGIRKAGTKKLHIGIDIDADKGEQTQVLQKWAKYVKLKRVISEILEAPYQGVQFIETTWAWFGKYYLPHKIEAKPFEWFDFDNANQPRFHKEDGQRVPLPKGKFLIVQHEPSYTNPYGKALLSQCFWPYIFKKGTYEFWITFTEKYGMPWAVAAYPRGWSDAEIDGLVARINDMIADGVLAVPVGVESSLVNVGGRGNVDAYKLLIENCTDQFAKVITGHTGTLNSTPGKLGSEDNAIMAREDLIEQDTELVIDTVQELFDEICRINFPQQSTFTLLERDELKLKVVGRDKELTAVGVNFSKSYIKRTYGLTDDDFEVVPINTGATPAAPFVAPAPPALSPGTEPTVIGERFAGFRGFAAGELDIPDDQSFIDDIQSGTPDQLNFQMGEIVAPVLERLSNAKSFGDALKALKELFPTMNSDDLTAALERRLFFSQLAGRLSVDAEDL